MVALQDVPPGPGVSGARSGATGAGQRWLLAAAALCFLAMLAVRWPGELTPDSLNQLQQARSGHLTDWHPPIMAAIWEIWPTPEAMLVMQAALHWFGIGRLATFLLSRGSVRWGWAMLLVGFVPLGFKYVGVIEGDSLLASFLIAAFGIASWSRVGALLLSIAGGLVRANGAFAVVPLWPHLVRSRSRALQIAAGVAAMLLIPAGMAANAWIFHAERTGVERSLQLYDLAGIAHFSGDPTVLPMPIDELDRCYTPLFWDTLAQPRCSHAWQRSPDSLLVPWLSAIARHPVAYAEHRLVHFSREIFFLVPAMQQCADAPEMHRCDFSRRGYAIDSVTKNPLFWPVTWLIAGLFLLFSRPEPLTRSLCLSGLVYGLAYLVVGVATDFRYFYWTELSVAASLVLHFGTGGRLPGKALALVLGAVWIAGYIARYAAFV